MTEEIIRLKLELEDNERKRLALARTIGTKAFESLELSERQRRSFRYQVMQLLSRVLEAEIEAATAEAEERPTVMPKAVEAPSPPANPLQGDDF